MNALFKEIGGFLTPIGAIAPRRYRDSWAGIVIRKTVPAQGFP